jgi:monovalent cation/hydrogen antiporter
VLTPFAAYLPAELLHVSGVVAVVSCGLLLSQAGARVVGARTRVVWGNTMPYVLRAIDRRPAQRLRRVGFRQRQPTTWAGFRGAVSLAAALAVPATRVDGSPLEGRTLVLLVTFGVILFTLVVQGLTLPAVVRWARLPDDPRERVEQHLAEETATRAARAAIDRRAAELGIPHGVVVRVRGQYEQHLEELELRHVDADGTTVDGDPRALAAVDSERRLRLALLADKRGALVRLRQQRRIDDLVLQRVQTQLDVEEVRLTGAGDED